MTNMKMNQSRDWYIPKNSQEIKATDCAAVAYLAPYTYASNGASAFHAVAFSGKRNKPDWNHTFKTEQQARDYIAKHAESRKRSEAFRAEQHAARYNVRAADHFKVGDCLHTSWGYDQTNVEFYKVVRVLAKSVEVVAIAGKSVAGSQGFMSERVLPDPDNVIAVDDKCSWAVQHNGIKRVVGGCNGEAHVRIHRHSSGYKISPNSEGTYCSWYA